MDTAVKELKTREFEHVDAGSRSISDSDFFGELDNHGKPVQLSGADAILLEVGDYAGRYALAKRSLDVIGAMLGILILGPIILLAMLAVFLKDGRQVIFSQRRVGRNGELFTMYKIRTMCVDAEDRLAAYLAKNRHRDQRTFKMDNDPRIIPGVGGILRKFSIDEFPQILNVLLGDMSLVGPRPALPREVEHYSAEDRLRLVVKPGLTCFWQVGGRCELDFKQQLALDIRYIEECSLVTDLKLIVLTVPALLFGGAR